MFRKLNLMFQGLFLTVLVSSLVVACGKQDSRKRPATAGQKTTGDVTGDKNKPADSSTQKDSKDEAAKKSAADKLAAEKAAAQRLADERRAAEGSKSGSTSGEVKPSGESKPKVDISTLAKLEQVDYELRKENHDKNFKAAFEKNAEIRNKIETLNLSLVKGKVEFSVKAKINVDSKETIINEVFEAQGVTPEDLKKGDTALKNSAGEQAKLKWDDVKLRILPSNEYLLRITKNENEVLGLLFEDSGKVDLKLTHVLGSEKESADLVKKYSSVTESNARSEESSSKWVNIADEALAKLEKARVTLEALDKKKILWAAIAETTMREHSEIVVQLKTIKDKAVSIRGTKGTDIQMLEQTTAGSVASIKRQIQLLASGLRAQVNDARQDETIRAGLREAVTTLDDINLPDLNLTSSGSKY